jgi:magnesium-transporting ATPase (P-type)
MNFTPEIRKAIYAAAASIVPLFTILGFLTEGQAQQVLSSIAAALAFFASITAIKNIPASSEEITEADIVDVEAPEIPGV